MKNVAILLMLLGLFVIVGYGFLYLLGFAMSFDAPEGGGSKAWLLRWLMSLPLLIFMVVVIFAWRAFSSGNYKRSIYFGLVFAVSGMGFIFYLLLTFF